jgi:hypothetical protein
MRRPQSHTGLATLKKNKRYSGNWLRQLQSEGLKPEIEILEEYETAIMLSEAERHFIAYFKFVGCRLTNLTDGGEGTSGFSPSLETRAKLSTALQGIVKSAETCHKLSVSHLGKSNGSPSIETRHKLSKAGIRRFLDPEVRRKQGIPHIGKSFSVETREKLAQSHDRRSVIDELGIVYPSINAAARRFGLNPGSVWQVLCGLSHKSQGHVFRYLEVA